MERRQHVHGSPTPPLRLATAGGGWTQVPGRRRSHPAQTRKPRSQAGRPCVWQALTPRHPFLPSPHVLSAPAPPGGEAWRRDGDGGRTGALGRTRLSGAAPWKALSPSAPVPLPDESHRCPPAPTGPENARGPCGRELWTKEALAFNETRASGRVSLRCYETGCVPVEHHSLKQRLGPGPLAPARIIHLSLQGKWCDHLDCKK